MYGLGGLERQLSLICLTFLSAQTIHSLMTYIGEIHQSQQKLFSLLSVFYCTLQHVSANLEVVS